MANLTLFETTFIRKQVSKMADFTIASMLEKDIIDVKQFIDKICLKEGIIPFAKKPIKKVKKTATARKKERTKEFPKKIEKIEMKRVMTNGVTKMVQSKYKTREVDYSQMVSLRIDDKTLIWISKDADPVAEKDKYFKRITKIVEDDPVAKFAAENRRKKHEQDLKKQAARKAKYPAYYGD